MTREELQAAQAAIARANELLRTIEQCEEFSRQNLSLRKGGGDWIGGDVAPKIVAAGIKAVRDEAEKELASLKIGAEPTPTIERPKQYPPMIVPLATRQKFDCKVCGNYPNEEGELNHGKGCYTQDENGGGTELIEDCCPA